ncbi:MAG: hypothetical protein JRJ19_05365, partial [Deltaproteobacteria bacterium]|nr:hypothetical protein [Deltaproteobacteria bacterium]
GHCQGQLKDCSAAADQCNRGVCQEPDGTCVSQADNNNQDCDDGLYCTTGEVCRQGVCTDGSVTDCDDSLGCTTDFCDAGDDECKHEPDNSACDDSIDCTDDSCSPVDGCHYTPNNSLCDDSVDCTNDSCVAGSGCQFTADDSNCDDGVSCTIDSCNAQNDCEYAPDDLLCDDGTACTTEICDVNNDCQYTPNAGGCPEYHIGPAADTCPHIDSGGGPTDVCDYSGSDGLDLAVAAAPVEGARFFIYDNLGSPTEYLSCQVPIPANSYLGAGPGVDPNNVMIACEWTDVGDSNGVIALAGDNIHIERLTIIVQGGAKTAISARLIEGDPTPTSSGHLINNVVAVAVYPELWGHNSIQEPLYLGPDMTVRNNHFLGYFENSWNFLYANNTRLINNTMVYFQRCGGEWDVNGTTGVVIANNVVLSLNHEEPLMILGDLTTTSLTVTGNVFEGFTAMIAGVDPGDVSNVVQDNDLGQAELESPWDPFFLANSTQNTGPIVPGVGTSLDDIDIEGQTGILPGAYQARSLRSGNRRMTVRVGDGDCGLNSCDFDASQDNEMQKAVWASWPGGTVEVYPSANPYAGNALMGWGVNIIGVGDQPEDVVLQSAEEDFIWSYYDLWERHESILTALNRMDPPIRVENLTLRLDADAMADERAICTEGDNLGPPGDWHQLRRLRFETVNSGPGLNQAMYLGTLVQVQDVLVHGAFHSCITFGMRRYDDDPTPETTGRVINVTCRLNGMAAHVPQSAFDVASVVDTIFINLAIELESPAPFLRAQRRSVGDTGATALDVPVSYTLRATSIRGHNDIGDGYAPGDGNYDVESVDVIAAADPFFVSDVDSHLDDLCTAIDFGIDPSTIDASLAPGVSLDGIDRQSVTAIDRGAYEQGL